MKCKFKKHDEWMANTTTERSFNGTFNRTSRLNKSRKVVFFRKVSFYTKVPRKSIFNWGYGTVRIFKSETLSNFLVFWIRGIWCGSGSSDSYL
jgi:hypothetical protein